MALETLGQGLPYVFDEYHSDLLPPARCAVPGEWFLAPRMQMDSCVSSRLFPGKHCSMLSGGGPDSRRLRNYSPNSDRSFGCWISMVGLDFVLNLFAIAQTIR